MSKLGDVNKMYGQDFGVAVTNASADIVANSERLMSNMMIISSPMNSNNEDAEYPALFATDYNGKPIQLSYSVFIGNGLALNPNRILYLNIDSQTIKPQNNDGPLYVDTSYLQIASFNKPGVAMVANTVSRAESGMPSNTFINVDSNGVLYLGNDFFNWFASQLNDAIYRNVAPLVNKNTRAWFTETTSDTIQSNYYDTDAIMVSPIGQTRDYIEKTLKLSFTSTESQPLTISIDDGNQTNDYPFMDLEYNNQTIIDESKTQTIAGISIYEHHVDGIKLRFFPNYYLINNKNYGDTIHYYLRVDTNTEDDENQDIIFNFYQYQGSEISFNNLTTSLSLYQLSTWINESNKTDQQIDLIFEYDNLVHTDDFSNKFEYALTIQYLGSTPITLYDDNITNLINNSNNKKINIKLNNLDTLASIILNASTLDQSTIQLSENSVRRYNSILKINVGGRQFTYSKEFTLDYNSQGNFDSSFTLYFPKLYSYSEEATDSYKLLNIGDDANINNISIKDDQSIKDIFQNQSIILKLDVEIGPENVSSLSSDQTYVLELVGGPTDSSFGVVPSSIDASITIDISQNINNVSKSLKLNPISILRKDFFNQNSQNGIYSLTMTMNSDHMSSKVITISIDIHQYIKNNISVYDNEDLAAEHKIDINDRDNPITLTIGSPIYIDFSQVINGLGVTLQSIAESSNWNYERLENNIYRFTPQSVSEGNIISLSPIFGGGEGDDQYNITIGNIFSNNSTYGGHDNSGGGTTPGGNTPSGGGEEGGNTPGGNTPSGGEEGGTTPSNPDIDYWNSQPSNGGDYGLGVYATDSAIQNNESITANQILGDTILSIGPDRSGETYQFEFIPTGTNNYGLRKMANTRSIDNDEEEIVYSANNINYIAQTSQLDGSHALAYMPYTITSKTNNTVEGKTGMEYLFSLKGTFRITANTDTYIIEADGSNNALGYTSDSPVVITSELTVINYKDGSGYIPLNGEIDTILTTDVYFCPYVSETCMYINGEYKATEIDWAKREIRSMSDYYVVQPNTGTSRDYYVRYMAPGFDGNYILHVIQHGDQDPGISFSVDVSNTQDRLIVGEWEVAHGEGSNTSGQLFEFNNAHRIILRLYVDGNRFDNDGRSQFDFTFSNNITSIKKYCCDEYMPGSTFDFIGENGIQISGNNVHLIIDGTIKAYPEVQTNGFQLLLNDSYVIYISLNLRARYGIWDNGFSFKDDLSLSFSASNGQLEADNATYGVLIGSTIYDLDKTLSINNLSVINDTYFGRTLEAYLVKRSESSKVLAKYINTEFDYDIKNIYVTNSNNNGFTYISDYFYTDGNGRASLLLGIGKLVKERSRTDDDPTKGVDYWQYHSWATINDGYRIKINGQPGYLPWVEYRLNISDEDIFVELYNENNPDKILASQRLFNYGNGIDTVSDTYMITSDVITMTSTNESINDAKITFTATKNGQPITSGNYYIKLFAAGMVNEQYSLNVESFISCEYVICYRNNSKADGAIHGNPFGIRAMLFDSNDKILNARMIFEAGLTGTVV